MQDNRQIQSLVERQRAFFESGATLPVSFRLESLKKLRAAILRREQEIYAALHADLGKSRMESYLCEVGMVLSELRYLLKRLKGFAKPKRVKTPLAQFPAKSYELSVPYGNTLIVSPWNYPFLLTVEPLLAALAAGNTAIVKPSNYSPATSALVKSLLGECFSDEYVAVVTGGRAENTALFGEKFDFIFFTGSQAVGKEVLKKAAEHCTPVALELGGKSPCVVDETANIPLAAKRIVFGKFINCGQTCVAPDYILCAKEKKAELVAELAKQIRLQFGENPLKNPDYGKIISPKHFHRLAALLEGERIAFGGGMSASTQQIEPTVLVDVCEEDAVMQEEIFGPILPVLTFERFDEVYAFLRGREKPLALYLFTEDKRRRREVPLRIRYGGGCINDTVIHLATSELGFGGVGESGMGTYHGKRGFDAFSHKKSIVWKKTWLDLPMRYQPYTKKHEKTVRKFLK